MLALLGGNRVCINGTSDAGAYVESRKLCDLPWLTRRVVRADGQSPLTDGVKMTRVCITICFALILVSPAVAQTGRNIRPLTAQSGEKWVIKWSRSGNFDGDSVDWRKWNQRP